MWGNKQQQLKQHQQGTRHSRGHNTVGERLQEQQEKMRPQYRLQH